MKTARAHRLHPRVRLERGLEERGGVLVDTHTATVCLCNDSAWELLQELRRGATLDALVERLTATFQVGERAARRDTEELLGRLRAMGLVDGEA